MDNRGGPQAAADGQEIWVKEGSYRLATEIFIAKPVALYGGFAGNERNREKRDWRKRPTLLDAPDIGRCLSLAADGVRISGFVFSFGTNSNGGAVMALPLSRFMIEDCLFEANSASLGGGLYSKNAAGTVNGCEFSGNTAKTKGGRGLRGILRFDHHQLRVLSEHGRRQRRQHSRGRCGLRRRRRRHHRQLHFLQQQHPLSGQRRRRRL